MTLAKSLCCIALGTAFSLLPPVGGHAWDVKGHQAVVEIAARFLSPDAVAGIDDLLDEGLEGMVDVSTWADEIVDGRPETDPWHTVRVPLDAAGYDRSRDCPNDACIVEQIKRFAARLGDRQLDRSERAEALKFLIHFVGDIHVPLHAVVRLNPGKGVWVVIGEQSHYMHPWWDQGFVDALGPTASAIARTLSAEIARQDRRAWRGTTPDDWANESFAIARDFIAAHGIVESIRDGSGYTDNPIVLPASVIEEMKPSIAVRLKMAGVRLAWLLNRAFR